MDSERVFFVQICSGQLQNTCERTSKNTLSQGMFTALASFSKKFALVNFLSACTATSLPKVGFGYSKPASKPFADMITESDVSIYSIVVFFIESVAHSQSFTKNDTTSVI